MNRLFTCYLTPVLATAAFALLTLPVWRWLWSEWMGNDYYSHGVLIAPVAVYLAVQRIRTDPTARLSPHSSNWALLLVVVGLGLFVIALGGRAYYMAAFAMIALLAGMVWTLGGNRLARALAFPLAYLALMVPLPFIERATLPLAMFTGVCSSSLVRFLGMDIKVVGNSVTLPNADLVIGAQCSGINSLIALTALTVLAAYLVQGPLWGRVLLALLAVPLALLSNILRVASLLFVAQAYGANAAFTFYHDYSGPVFFLLSLALLWPLARLLRCDELRLNVI